MIADVYFNLHRKVWSVRNRSTGRVEHHWRCVAMLDVDFKVSAAGRARVLREGRKNVHAYARGYAVLGVELGPVDCSGWGVRVTYNPRKAPFFYDKSTGREVEGAKCAFLGSDRSVTVYEPVYGPRVAVEV